MDLPLPEPAPPWLDAREVRVSQGAVAIALLAGFVFRVPLVIPAAAVVLAAGVAFGPSLDLFHRMFRATAGRRGAAEPPADHRAVRMARLVVVAVLTVATAALALDWLAVAWAMALLVAGAWAVAATTQVDVTGRVGARLARLRPR